MEQNGATFGRVLIVGIGGLGVPAALGLGRSGQCVVVGLMDAEKIELSNLARQVIFRTGEVGASKAAAAAHWIRGEFPNLTVAELPYRLDSSNARQTIAEYDFVIDGTDDPAIKFLINDACLVLGRPFTYGGVLGFSGQAMTVVPGRTACLRCLFETPPHDADTANCRDAGVLGPVVGAIGAIQAREALAFLQTATTPLAGKMLTYDASAASRIRVVEIKARADCACVGVRPSQQVSSRKSI